MSANFRNRTLYHGDNLEFLRGINSETIDLVATDPPFNKGRDFHATPDSLAKGAKFHDRWSWDKDIEEPWREQIRTDWPAVWEVIDAANHTWGEDMGAFLCYMGVRLMEMHRVLKPTGSLWLHCDDTAGAYLVMMMDAIFGRKQRQDIVTWKRQSAHFGASKSLGRICDTLLRYTKTQKFVWEPPRVERGAAELKEYQKDENGRLFKADDLTQPSSDPHSSRRFEWRGTTPGESRVWGYSEEALEQMLAEGRILMRLDGRPRLRGAISYLDERPLPQAQNLWTDIERVGNTAAERTGYPTQKPIALYKRIILASSNPDDVVLDPFCGCATTLIAAEQEGRQWIGMDLWDEALTVVQDRVEKECANLFGGAITYSETPPLRTDDGAIAAPPLKVKRKGAIRSPEPGPVLPRAEMLALLHERQEGKCAGCDRVYDDLRIWHIDHLNPRSAGGVNHDSNRCLLCPPCNSIKSDTMTLTALRNHNRKNGLMA